METLGGAVLVDSSVDWLNLLQWIQKIQWFFGQFPLVANDNGGFSTEFSSHDGVLWRQFGNK